VSSAWRVARPRDRRGAAQRSSRRSSRRDTIGHNSRKRTSTGSSVTRHKAPGCPESENPYLTPATARSLLRFPPNVVLSRRHPERARRPQGAVRCDGGCRIQCRVVRLRHIIGRRVTIRWKRNRPSPRPEKELQTSVAKQFAHLGSWESVAESLPHQHPPTPTTHLPSRPPKSS